MVGTVLIAGASQGIGLEFARQYAGTGYRVIAGCRNPTSASALELLRSDHDIVVRSLDTGSDESVASFVARVGDQPIDIAIILAGVMGGEKQPFGAIGFSDLANIRPHSRLRRPACVRDYLANGDHP